MKALFLLVCVSTFTLSFGQVPLLFETFDTGIPAGWTIIDNDGNTPHPNVSEYTDAWITVEDPDDVSNFVASSTSYFQPVDRADRWLITPNITLGPSGNFISWYGKSHDASFPDSYKILISNTGTAITDFTDTLMLVSNESPDWTFRELEIEQFADENVHIAFVITTFNGFKLYLDTFDIRKEDPLSLDGFSNELEVVLYPNPVSDKLKVKGANANAIHVFSPQGQLVSSIVNQNELNLANLPDGIYFVEVTVGTAVIRKKVLKI